MRFTLMLGLGGHEDYAVLARAAEDCAWNALSVPDSIFYPKISESDYPYADTAAVRSALEATPVIDPLVAIAGMAAVTQRLRFYPGVLKVPVRQPLVLAKALSSLAVMSGGRVSLGAGLSPWKEDFIYNGVEFEGRGKLMDECLEVLRLAMSGDYFEYHSDHFSIGEVKLSPVPATPVPILIGGHARPALRRAARLGDGWISANTDLETLQSLIDQLGEFRAEYDSPESFEIHALDSNLRSVEDCQQLAQLGVTDICVTPWNPYQPQLSLDDKLAAIDRFANTIIAKL
ncbi:MAG: TIGR03619 family F420-dependent LLM class oxidoreductase [Halieaceae bacterium]